MSFSVTAKWANCARTRLNFPPPLALSGASYDDTRLDKQPKGISDIVDTADIMEAPQLSLAYQVVIKKYSSTSPGCRRQDRDRQLQIDFELRERIQNTQRSTKHVSTRRFASTQGRHPSTHFRTSTSSSCVGGRHREASGVTNASSAGSFANMWSIASQSAAATTATWGRNILANYPPGEILNVSTRSADREARSRSSTR